MDCLVGYKLRVVIISGVDAHWGGACFKGVPVTLSYVKG